MPNSSRWSTRSRACRIELRSSRMLAALLVALGLGGVPGWFLSDAGPLLATCGAGAGLAWALRLAATEAMRPRLEIVLGADGRATVEGRELDAFEVERRGPLTMLSWRCGSRLERRLAFPDAIDAASRRELRLWVLAQREHAAPAAVAP